MAYEEALKALSVVADALIAERAKLDKALVELEATGKLLSPSFKLSETPQKEPPAEVIKPEPPVVVADQRLQERADEARREGITSTPTLNLQTLKERILEYVAQNSPARPTKMDEHFLDNPAVLIAVYTTAKRELLAAKKLRKNANGGLIISSTVPGATLAHAYPDGADTALCGFKRSDAQPPSTGRCSKCTDLAIAAADANEQAHAQAVTVSLGPPDAPKPAPTPVPKVEAASVLVADDANRNDDGTYGLARSPVPRSEMRSQQVGREERMDAIVAWAQDNGPIFDPLTCNRVFSIPKQQMGDAFRTLVARGVFVEQNGGKDYFPAWMIEERKGKTGRGTKAYKLASPKADPAPTTQESSRELPPKPAPTIALTQLDAPSLEEVRDAAIELKSVTLGALIEKLDKDNTRLMRTWVKGHMITLCSRGVFKDDGEFRWNYVPPTDMGSAARVDIARRPTAPERIASQAVAGTGRGLQTGRKEVQRLIDAIVRQWGADKVSKQGNNHFVAITPGGDRIRFASTPSQRSMLNDFRKFRNAGLAF